MRVLVTGSTGFLGSQLCRALVQRGAQVVAFHRPSSWLRGLEGLPVEHAAGDLTRPETLAPAMQGVDVVFHAAALLDADRQPGKAYTVTVEGTRAVLEAALQAGVQRVVHTSSVAALGLPSGGMPLTEDSTWNCPPDRWLYGYTKYLAELEVQAAVARGLDAVIVNPTYVLGPGDLYRQSSSPVVLVAERRIPALVEGGLNVVHVHDVIAGHLAALEHGRCGHRYLLGGENMTVSELINRIAAAAGVPAPRVWVPGTAARRLGRLLRAAGSLFSFPLSPHLLELAGYNFWVDTQKSRAQLRLGTQRSADQAIRDAYAWFVEAGAIRRSHSSSGS